MTAGAELSVPPPDFHTDVMAARAIRRRPPSARLAKHSRTHSCHDAGYREYGVTLLEVLVTVAILGIALGGLLPAIWSAVRRNVDARETVRARFLATEIYEEMVALPRERALGTPSRPPPLPTVPRADFTTLLDYDNLEEVPPKDPLGEPIPDAHGLTRRVDVKFVDPRDPEREAYIPTDLVQVEVTISKGEETLEHIQFLRSRR